VGAPPLAARAARPIAQRKEFGAGSLNENK